MKKEKNFKKLEALNQLKKIMQKCKDKRIYAMVLHVSNSGMSRTITFKAIDKHGNLYNVNELIHRITGYAWSNSYYGLRVYGCGMDMIFNTLYNVNCIAINYGIIKASKNKDNHFLRYEGLVNSNYWSL